MDKVLVYLQAYNSESTIRRAIESILNQTYPNFILYICDNGSTDNTPEIIKEYKEQDDRIVAYFNEKNDIGVFFDVTIPRILNDYNAVADFFCMLDGDDEYYCNFIENTVGFMKQHRLDIAACGSDFILEQTKECVQKREIAKDLFIEGSDFEKYFPVYFQFMRTIWGKMYRFSLISSMDYQSCKGLIYGADTLFAQEAFRWSDRVGIMKQVLHKYYISNTSSSYHFKVERIQNDIIMFERTENFLLWKCKNIRWSNWEFLQEVYYYAIMETTKVLLASTVDNSCKLDHLYEIYTNVHTRELCKMWKNPKDFQLVLLWLISYGGLDNAKDRSKIAEILAIVRLCPATLKNCTLGDLFLLQVTMHRYIPKRKGLPDIEAMIRQTAQRDSLLSYCTVGFLIRYNEVVADILDGRKQDALWKILKELESGDIVEQYIPVMLTLGLNLSSLFEEEEAFIYVKKWQICHLLNTGMKEQALAELSDWDSILPQDEDFRRFRKELGNKPCD